MNTNHQIETRTYSDGTVATGVAPLPAESPKARVGWSVCNCNECMVVDENGAEIAESLGDYDTDYERMSKRASLIAASPDLLEVAELLIAFSFNSGDPLWMIRDKARAAVNKVNGVKA
ncbi:hypothetical protein KBW71_03495 [Hydrogenophaga aromaticivorans]|uniref:hypothetical protein n=1 Tax=Hydrogenophaga aromaticivorans TaxID=2610898 RepID=UPI001B38FFBA|nr:hypothetical protein [Hydrogenophaga aromaticivorans]MBQ0917494.1 hypothetical protein [Hydrogenophaga aromaticivorans]